MVKGSEIVSQAREKLGPAPEFSAILAKLTVILACRNWQAPLFYQKIGQKHLLPLSLMAEKSARGADRGFWRKCRAFAPAIG